MASMEMMYNGNDAGHSGEHHVKYNNFVGSESSTGKSPLRKVKQFSSAGNNYCGSCPNEDDEQPCSSRSLEEVPCGDEFEMSQFEEVQEITEKSKQICHIVTQIRETFHSLFNQPTHIVPLRNNKRSKQSVMVKRRRMSIGMKIKFELYGELCINWLKNTIKLIKNFYEIWIPKAQQNVLELKYTATKLEESDEHITRLLYVKDSKVMNTWDDSENVFLQHAVSDLSTYILKHKTYRFKEKLHQEYSIIEQNIYALLESLHSTLNVLKRHYRLFDKLSSYERSSEEDEDDWVTEEIVDVEQNKVYTCEVAI